MPRTPIQFQQMKDERKLSILESALPLFAIYGSNDVSIDMICQKAKCSHGLFYHYFKNCEQIYKELLTSDSYKNIKNELLNLDENANEFSQVLSIAKKLLNIIKEPRFTVCFANIIISEADKNSLYYKLTKLVESGQKKRLITGGKPVDIVETFLFTIKGIYFSLLTKKHSDIRVPSIDNILNIFKY